MEKAEDGWRVFFLDYGEQRDVAECDILRLPDKFCTLPAQAIECSLVLVNPIGRPRSARRSYRYFTGIGVGSRCREQVII